MKQKRLKKEFDSLIKELFNEKYNSIQCPPVEEMWREFEHKLINDKKVQKTKQVDTGK